MEKRWWHKSRSHSAIFSLIFAAIFMAVFFAVTSSIPPLTGAEKRADPLRKLTPVGMPIDLFIPSISVKAHVQNVGLDENGRMGIPTNFVDVAWYKLGPRPGENGSAVIDGHLDTARDASAVFGRLSELKEGDDIYVKDENGQIIYFKVTETAVYEDAKAPLQKIFGYRRDGSFLNLITCDGVWSEATKSYDKKLVVYSARVVN